MDSLNKLMANKEELKKVLERHIVPGVRMEGKEVPDGSTKHISASGDELRTEREKFVKVEIFLSWILRMVKKTILPSGPHSSRVSVCSQIWFPRK